MLKQIELPFVDFFKKEIDFRSSMAYSSEDFRDTVDMMALGRPIAVPSPSL
jgi:threonine dehydrogenase-like Zn-dependent dehydrogenase